MLACLVLFSVVASGFSRTPLFAQEGHPLVGTWYGDWGSSPQNRHDVTIVMTWDGKSIGGTIDSGTGTVTLASNVTFGNNNNAGDSTAHSIEVQPSSMVATIGSLSPSNAPVGVSRCKAILPPLA